jgi:hypothetical protein
MADFYFCCVVALLAHDSLAYVTADDSLEQVETVSDYNEYCHYAAGLAGLGLSRLFYASGLEEFPPDILSNSMGLFIQVPVMYYVPSCFALKGGVVPLPVHLVGEYGSLPSRSCSLSIGIRQRLF